jgi:hypothetical protein
MRKFILIIILLLFSKDLFAITVSPDYKAEGLGWFSSLSYDNIFNSDYKYFTIDIFGVSLFPSSSKYTGHLGFLTQFSFDINIFDIYYYLGFTIYPFGKIFSISSNLNLGWSLFIFNHFSYITDIKANIDILLYKGCNITFGAGLRHRNALKISNWLKLNDNYFKIYNSYFFEIGYRFIIK